MACVTLGERQVVVDTGYRLAAQQERAEPERSGDARGRGDIANVQVVAPAIRTVGIGAVHCVGVVDRDVARL